MIKRAYKSFLRFMLAVCKMPKAIRMAKLKSYYPELKRKRYITRVFNNLGWLFKYKEVNIFYTLYGLDIKGSNAKAYKDNRSFMRQRNLKNRARCPDSQIGILRDKLLFFKFMDQAGLPVPEVFGFLYKGKLYDVNLNEVNEQQLLQNKTEYFVKDLSGECASFVKKISDYNEYLTIKDKLLPDEGYIFQEKISQCEQMNVINPNAINTLRIVTVNKDGNPYVFSAVLRVGTSKSGNVDNWAAGGLSIGVNEDGSLSSFGFYKIPEKGKTDVHPDTGVVFAGFKIPEYDQCVKATINAHKQFYGIRFIGWDVAITKNGPIFIEGNDNWEISLIQASNGPLKEEWNKAVKND